MEKELNYKYLMSADTFATREISDAAKYVFYHDGYGEGQFLHRTNCDNGHTIHEMRNEKSSEGYR